MGFANTGDINSERTNALSGAGLKVCFLTSDDMNANFAIILHNVRTYRSGGVIAVIRNKRKAEETLDEFRVAQSSTDQYEGWRYFIEPTTLPPGTDPVEATRMRQAELELRESEASGNGSPAPNSER